MTRPSRSRWSLKPIEAGLPCRPGARVRFLVEATNWGPVASRVHIAAEGGLACTVTPVAVTLLPGHTQFVAVRVEVPADAAVGQRENLALRLHGARRPVGCELEVVVDGDREEAVAPPRRFARAA